MPDQQIADRPVIMLKTPDDHLEHTHVKIDASERAAAAMFAGTGLLPEKSITIAAAP